MAQLITTKNNLGPSTCTNSARSNIKSQNICTTDSPTQSGRHLKSSSHRSSLPGMLQRLSIFTSRSNRNLASLSPEEATAIQARHAIQMENKAAALEVAAHEEARCRMQRRKFENVAITEYEGCDQGLEDLYKISHGSDVLIKENSQNNDNGSRHTQSTVQ